MNVQNYNKNRGVASPIIEHGDIACGFWMCGNDYHNKSSLYGAYPPCYLPRMELLFPDEFGKGEVLHLFSGSIRPLVETRNEWGLDINPPTEVIEGIEGFYPGVIKGDAEEVDIIFGEKYPMQFDLVLADPPYDDNHIKYGTKKVNKKKTIKACAQVVKPGGFLVWLDTIMPIWSKADGWKLRGTIGLLQSTNHKVRVISILENRGGGVS